MEKQGIDGRNVYLDIYASCLSMALIAMEVLGEYRDSYSHQEVMASAVGDAREEAAKMAKMWREIVQEVAS
jgi:hypothetical protein